MNNTKSEDTINLSGILKKVLYFNEENNYYIAILQNNQKICGQYFDTDLNKFEGKHIKNMEYNLHLQVYK
jgi:exodeoxyribonuclease V alpha subunit